MIQEIQNFHKRIDIFFFLKGIFQAEIQELRLNMTEVLKFIKVVGRTSVHPVREY